MLDRALLARYLRQRADLGERELFLEDCSARELLAALASRPSKAEGKSGRGGEWGQPGSSAPVADPAEPASVAARFAQIRETLAGSETAVRPSAAGKQEKPARPVDAGVVSHSPALPLSHSAESARPSPGHSALQILGDQARTCTACRLSEGRRNVVFGEGDPAARLVVVGEAPGQEEDRTGRPFVGQAGKLLDLLLMSAGFPRDGVYICNTLKCRPPQNRNPLPDELDACSGFLRGQLAAIAPRVLLAVGKFAAQTLVGSEESISRLRGRVFRYEGIPLVVTYHPAFLLRSPQWTVTAWEDFQLARKVLDEQA